MLYQIPILPAEWTICGHQWNMCGKIWFSKWRMVHSEIIYRKLYILSWQTVSALTRLFFWCLFPGLRSSERNDYQDNNRVSAETVSHDSTYFILFLTRHNESINDDKKDDLSHSLGFFVLLMTSQLWHDNVNNGIELIRYRFFWQRHSRSVV